MPNKRDPIGLSGVFLCCCLVGCAVGPDYHPVDIEMPDAFAAGLPDIQNTSGATAGQRVIDAAIWWKSLEDPELDSLIDGAIENNPDLEIALDRVQEARTQEEVVLGGALPEAGASFGGGGGTGSDMARDRAADAERQEYDLEAQYVTAQQDAAEQFVGLYKALGGGWEPYQAFPPIRKPLPAVMAAFASVINSYDPQKE